MRTAALLPGVWLVGLVCAPAPARACSCAEEPFDAAHDRAAAIFEGRAAAVEAADGGLRWEFDVVQTWRAAEHEHVFVRTASDAAQCGYPFVIGTSYLVYASAVDGDAYVASLCSRTRAMADADGDRSLLGSGVVPVDVVDDPTTAARATTRPPPTRAGCASCSVASRSVAITPALLLLLLLGQLARRRARSRS